MLGRPVTVQLINDGFDIRLFTTRLERAREMFGDRIDYATGSVSDLQSLKDAMVGYDNVYINLKGGPTNADYIRVEQEGSINIYTAAKETGVKKVVQISEARADEKYSFFITERVKYEAAKVLKKSGLTYVILKPTMFCETLPLFLQKGKAVYIGSGRASFHFLAASDYANIVSQCFTSDKADNKELTIFGPEPMPIPEAMRRLLAIVHPDCKIEHLPVWLARISAWMMFDKNLKMAVRLMAFFDKYDDSEVVAGPGEADSLFGRRSMTVEQWSIIYRKAIKGV